MAVETGSIPTETPDPGAQGGSGPENGPRAGANDPGPAPDPGNGTETATGEGERDENGRYLTREAAGFRHRLREVEAERDAIRAQLDRVQTAEVERLARGAGLAEPSDVWTFGAVLANLRAEDGSIDGETVTGLVGDILKSRPGLKAPTVGSLGIGRGGSAMDRTHGPKVGLSQLLKP